MIAAAGTDWAGIGALAALVISLATAAGGLLMLAAWKAERANRQALEARVHDGAIERSELEGRLRAEMAAQELRCREENGILRGRLDAVTDGWLDRMAEKLGDKIAEVLDRRAG